MTSVFVRFVVGSVKRSSGVNFFPFRADASRFGPRRDDESMPAVIKTPHHPKNFPNLHQLLHNPSLMPPNPHALR